MAGNLLNQLFQRRKPGFWLLHSWYMQCLPLTHWHVAADCADRRCGERWLPVFCEGKNQFVLARVAENVTLGWWGFSLTFCPEPTHTKTRPLSLEGRGVRKRGDEERHEQAARGGNREKTDDVEGKKWKTMLNREHLVFLLQLQRCAELPLGGCF